MRERRPTLMLIDGPSLVYRGYFALPPLTTSDGTLVNAAFGFLQIVLRGMADLKPDYAILTFDLGKPQFRFDRHSDYKAGRPSMPDDLRSQFPIVRELAGMLGMPIYEVEGFEADDVIASLVREAVKIDDLDTYIVSGDLDGMQLVDDRVRLLTTRMGVAATVIYDRDRVMERYGLRPDQMLDYKALKGDTSDNIPGVPGVGEKTASSLLQQFGSLDALYERLDEVPGKLRERLATHRELAFMSREVGRLVDDLPLAIDLESARTGRYDRRAVAQRFRELEFRSLIDRLPASVFAPTGSDPEPETPGGLQLTLDFAATDGASPAAPTADRTRVAPVVDALADPRGAIETLEPRIARTAEDLAELGEWLAAQPEVALSWAALPGRTVGRTLLGIGIASPRGAAWYVPWDDHALTSDVRRWLERADRPLVGHDVKPLMVMLAVRGIEVGGTPFDTLVASYMLNPALRAQSLDDLAAARFSAELPPRPVAAETGAEEWPVARRATSEALTSALLRPALESELETAGAARLFHEVEMRLVPILARMELAGIAIDGDVLAGMSAEFGGELARLERGIYDAVGREFNIGSPKQLEQVLFTELKLPAGKRTRTGYSTDASVLDELRTVHPAVGLILEHRQIAKLKSTYVDALPALVEPSTGRVHTTFNQAVASTGRLSSADPNLQNIPIRTALGRRIRHAFVAAPGRLLLAADYSQVELRILAHVSGDPGLKAAFAAQEDIHRMTAARVLKIPPEEVTAEQRSMAKMVNFGVAYGMSDFGLSERLHIDREEAQRFIAEYFAAYEGIRRYVVEIKIRARDQGFVSTLLGRRRYIPELTARNPSLRQAGERMAINMPIQGTAADAIKIAMVRLEPRLRERAMRSRMLLQVHDELVFETDEEELPALAALASETMEAALPLSVPLTVELKVGRDWERMDRLELAEGGWRRVARSEEEIADEVEDAAVLAVGA